MKKLPTFTLPPGWSFLPPGVEQSLIPGAPDGYGGADISRDTDGAGILHVAFCATAPEGTPEPRFRFRVFKYAAGVWSEVALQRVCTGRGEISTDSYWRRLTWAAWNGPKQDTDWVPGAVQIPLVAGPAGPRGATGPQGPQGVPGDGSLTDDERAALAKLTRMLAALGA